MFSLSLFMIACLALFVCMLLPGNKGSNRYGADPYEGSGANAFALSLAASRGAEGDLPTRGDFG